MSVVSVKRGRAGIGEQMKREEIEQKLGQQMHKLSLQQEIVKKENDKLRAIQNVANDLDSQLKELDGQ
jgi:hypothetical protein